VPSDPPRPDWFPHAVGALIVMLGATAHAVSARHLVTPDSVAYLDLAEALRNGFVGRWVQGYWSPLYPALLAAIDVVADPSRLRMLEILHVVQVLLVAAGAVLLWRMSRALTDTLRVAAIWTAYAFAIMAFDLVPLLTPDLLLLITFMGVAYTETRGAGRGGGLSIARGLLLGLSFWVKTSVLPWLAVLAALAIARDLRATRRLSAATAATLAAAAVVVAAWIVPLSVKAGHLTTGTTASLNWDWYVRYSDARSPDSHAGNHQAYERLDLIRGEPAIVARYADSSGTWAPWNDPSAWARGVISANRVIPTDASIGTVLVQLASGTAREASRTFIIIWPLLVMLVPLAVDWRRRRLDGDADAAVPALAVAGLLGLAMFSLLHVEARLLMPYALLLALALLIVPAARAMDASVRRLLLAGALVVAADTAFWTYRKLNAQLTETGLYDQRTSALATLYASATGAERTGSVVVVGPVAGVMGDLWLAGQRVRIQLLPASMERGWARLPVDVRIATLRTRFGAESPYIWFTSADGELNILPMREAEK
jgi:hypothetical protein